MDYTEIVKDSAVLGFIDKEKILSYVSEEEIFELVFGFKPVEYDYTCSPFREDTNPGCWFERSLHNNKLIFIDYGDPLFNSQDCFSCVKRYFKLSNFYQTLLFIKSNLIDHKGTLVKINREKDKVEFIPTEKVRVQIYIKPRNFIQSDKMIWFKYGITRKQLVEDKVIPVSKFTLRGTKKGDITSTVFSNCYAYTDFEGNRKKLYSPYKKGKGKFITNCGRNDVGGINSITNSTQIIITKSYKDWRVLKNEGVNSVWFQNEGMIPEDDLLFSFLSNYSDIVIFFDNDSTGLIATKKVVEKVNSLLPDTARSIYLPEELLPKKIKDASDMYYIKSKEELRLFLTVNNVMINESNNECGMESYSA